ncbi:MAG: cell division protein FtsQ/DivIB [Candidatus Omnitrophota bacterium]|jgi:cell division septal protein FtsQ
MKKTGFRIPLKLILLLVFLAVAYLGLAALLSGLKNLDYFKVKEVVVSSAGEASDFAYFKGRGIFDIDLRSEAGRIWQLYPGYKRVMVIRVLPNRLFVKFVKRQPLAYVKLYRYFCVDEELVLLDMPASLEDSNLPVILGLDTRIFGPKVGRRYNVPELALAVGIINEIQRNHLNRYIKVKTINVASAANAVFITDSGIEVRVGQENIKTRIGILRDILSHSRNELANMKYIDLRFKDPVIKPKEDVKR